jgi:hypothetical protein
MQRRHFERHMMKVHGKAQRVFRGVRLLRPAADFNEAKRQNEVDG